MKRSFDLASALGPIVAVVLIVYGIVLNTDLITKETTVVMSNLINFVDVPSMIIVFGGTLGCLLFMFPMSQFAKIPKHLLIVFMPPKYVPERYIETLVELAKKAREKGLLSLEEDAAKVQDSFLKNGLQLLIDSVDSEKIKQQMEEWLDNLDERHAQERAIYDKGASLAPAFGMIGTLIGLINMLKTLEDVASVGPNMAVALVTTFYGSLLANVIFAPISNKLRTRNDEEFLCMRIVIEGLQAIQAGENPNLIQSRLINMLPAYKQKKLGSKAEKGGYPAEDRGTRGTTSSY